MKRTLFLGALISLLSACSPDPIRVLPPEPETQERASEGATGRHLEPIPEDAGQADAGDSDHSDGGHNGDAGHSDSGHKEEDAGETIETICHNGKKTLDLPYGSAMAHLMHHDDFIGRCKDR